NGELRLLFLARAGLFGFVTGGRFRDLREVEPDLRRVDQLRGTGQVRRRRLSLVHLKMSDAEIVEGFRAIRVGLQRFLENVDRLSRQAPQLGGAARMRRPSGRRGRTI